MQVTPLAHVTEWLPVPAIREAVERTLNVERRLSLAFRPLQHQEILALLLEHPSTPTPKVQLKNVRNSKHNLQMQENFF